VLCTKTRDEWSALLEGSDACFAPVLAMDEAHRHPHAAARHAFVEIDGVAQPAPAPRFDRSVPDTPRAPPEIGAHTREVLAQAGYSADEIAALLVSGVAR
jgi:alpha-methylacyl-CoA racemase